MAIDLNDYVLVKDRVRLFYERYPEGSISSRYELATVNGQDTYIVTALAYREPGDPAPGIGLGKIAVPGKTPFTRDSELENAQTKAWGRAIGSLGIGIEAGLATYEEVAGAVPDDRVPVEPIPPATVTMGGPAGRQQSRENHEPITPKQLALVEKRLLPDIPEDDYKRIVTEYLGEYRPPKAWTKREAMGPSRDQDGLIDLLTRAKEQAMGGVRSSGRQDDDPWATP